MGTVDILHLEKIGMSRRVRRQKSPTNGNRENVWHGFCPRCGHNGTVDATADATIP